MSREILFRGKCVSDSKYAGEWVTGGYVSLSEDITPNNEGLIMRFLGGNTTITYHVDPDTVCQFTGMKDRYDKKIFEGDVLYVTVFDCFDNDKQYRVRVEWVGTEFIGVDVTNDDSAWNLCWLCNQDEEIEVIGNIHANSDLLSSK